MPLLDRLRTRIRSEGPLSFETFMEACLYDPEGGFYTSGVLRSVESGDFLTSPEVSPWFGRTLAGFVAAERERAGGGAFRVIDVGAGSGSLLSPLLAALESDGVEVWALDRSPAALAALADGDWQVGADLRYLPEGPPSVLLANELLDNMPAALAVRAGDEWEERLVAVEGERLVLTAAPARPEVARWCDGFAGRVPEGGMVEVQLAAGEWLRDALSVVGQGAVAVIDYGGTMEELEPRRTRGTLRTYRAHHLGPDPLLEPGQTDVTVDVNFTALLAIAAEEGAAAELWRQDDFLAEWGLRDKVRVLRREELELARGEDAMARLQVRSELTSAETLLHPRGLGDFRVLVARPK